MTMPYSSEPATAPLIEPRPPMITTTSELQQPLAVRAGGDSGERGDHHPAHPGEEAPTKNVTANTTAMLMPSARTIAWSATPARIDDAHARAVEPQPQQGADERWRCRG